jgi:putative peptidoglycan lipid II flippase
MRRRGFFRCDAASAHPGGTVSDALKSSGRVSAAVFGSRIVGLVREQVFAALFGAGAIADAYTVAFRIPNLLRDLFAEGALSSAFVPTFTDTLETEGEARAHALANLAASGLLVVTGAITALGIVFAEPLVDLMSKGFGGDAAKVALATELTRVMMPFLCIVSLSAVWMGMLNAQRRFVVPALAPAIFNVVSIAVGVLVWLLRGSPTEGVLVWSAGTLAAGAAQALVQLPALWRMGYRPRVRFFGFFTDPGIRRIARLMTPALLGLAAVQLNLFVNTGFAGELGDGAVAQLGFAFRLFFLPLGVFGVALATVTMTSVSEEAARGDRTALVARTADGVWAAWMLTAASAVGLFLLAEPVCRAVYLHGRVTLQDVDGIACALRAYVGGLVPYTLVKILAPAYYSVDRPRYPLVGSLCAVGVNIAFNALTYRELGAPGIALGTTLGATVNVLVLRLSMRRVVAPLPGEGRGRNAWALVLANTALAGFVLGAWWAVELGLDAWLPDRASALRTWLTFVPLIAVIGAGFLLYVAILRRAGYPGAESLARLPGAVLRRLRPRSRKA